MPFAVARALVHGDLSLRDFTEQGLRDEAANLVASRITYKLVKGLKGGLVRVVTNDGQEHEIHIETPLGHPSRPIPYERLVSKFRDCCQYSVTPLSTDRVDQLIAVLENLQDEDFTKLATLSSAQQAVLD